MAIVFPPFVTIEKLTSDDAVFNILTKPPLSGIKLAVIYTYAFAWGAPARLTLLDKTVSDTIEPNGIVEPIPGPAIFRTTTGAPVAFTATAGVVADPKNVLLISIPSTPGTHEGVLLLT
jgi:hypothetical protein